MINYVLCIRTPCSQASLLTREAKKEERAEERVACDTHMAALEAKVVGVRA